MNLKLRVFILISAVAIGFCFCLIFEMFVNKKTVAEVPDQNIISETEKVSEKETEPFEKEPVETKKITETEAPEETLPAMSLTDVMIDVPYISQEGILPNGCEAVCATMLLQYCGFEIAALEFVRTHLITDYFIKDEYGRLLGPDPENAYAGDPESFTAGFGCYPPAIISSIESFLSTEYSVTDLSGKTLIDIANEYLANNIPVAVWMTVDMRKTDRWIYWYNKEDEGKEEMREIEYPANLHVMVLCGYDGESFIFADPYDSRGIVKYSYAAASHIYESMGSRALAITKNF